jgi:signal transduction histidine kinase/ActR/RegA family two-component response regulator
VQRAVAAEWVRWGRSHHAPLLAALVLVYFLAGKLGLHFAFVHASASAVWPPTGIALAAVLLFGRGVWPAIFVGAFLVNVSIVGSITSSVGIAAGNTLEALIGAFLVERFAGGVRNFDRAQTFLRFIVLAGMVGTALSATIGAASLALTGEAEWATLGTIWLTWWLGDAAGALLVAPLLLLWGTAPFPGPLGERPVEALLLFLVVAATGILVFGHPFLGQYPLAFLCTPPLLWAVFRFGQREVATAVAVLAMIATLATVRGLGPFVMSSDNESLLLLQAFMATIVALTFPVSALVQERRAIEAERSMLLERERASNVLLESRVTAAGAELARRLEEVQAAREQAEQASLGKSRFFAAASHDLRQPLHSLGLFAAALDGHVASREAHDLVARIGDSISALEALFNELLDLSRLDAGAVAVNPRDFALQDLFDRMSLEFHGEAVERHLRMRFVPTGLAVRADPVLLERVLMNLVSNALRYTQHGGVAIGARRRGGAVSLEVIDTGVGIPAAKQAAVFDEFYQIGNPGRDRRLGLGLGLAIVRRLVTLMGHDLALQSVPGRGTRFRITLPRAASGEPLARAEPDPGVEAFAGRTVLLVEDDPDIRAATTGLLQQWGLQVAACNAREQVEAMLDAGLDCDMALVDLRLETVDDGIDVIELLRERLNPELPALLLSGDTGAAELARVRRSGVRLLTKPVSPARLKSALHAYLSGAASITTPVVRTA